MEPALWGQIAGVADKVTSFVLVLIALVAGARGIWVWGTVVKDKDERIKRLEAKVETQERLIDRLSGLADRATVIATPAVVHQISEHRRRLHTVSEYPTEEPT